MLLSTSDLRARWRAVAEREAEERRRTPVDVRWQQLNALIHRPIDLADIRAIVENYPTLEREYVRQWVEAFAEVLEAPYLWEDIRPLLTVENQR